MSYITYGTFNFIADSGFPVPQISISTTPQRTSEAGFFLWMKTIVNLEGQIYVASGSRGFGALTDKEKILRETFSNGCIQPIAVGCTGAGGSRLSPFFSGLAQVNNYSSNKTQDRWASTIDYAIELQIMSTGSGAANVLSAQDEINIETVDEYSYVGSPFTHPALRTSFNFPASNYYPIYRISRTTSAVGIANVPSGSGSCLNATTGSNPLLRNAMAWVYNQLQSTSIQSIISGLDLFNFTRSINANSNEGSYRLTDNFFAIPTGARLSGISYIESFNVESNLDATYLRTVTIQGTIKGMETFNTGVLYGSNLFPTGNLATGQLPSGALYGSNQLARIGSKFAGALSGYSGLKLGNGMFNRAMAFIERSNDPSGIFRRVAGRDENPINPIPVTVNEGYNPAEGSVTYSWVFNNRPLNLVSGSISESLSVNDTFPTQQVSEIFVLGRKLGPVLQDLGSYTSASREVTFEVVMIRPSSLTGLKFPKAAYTAITGIVELFNPKYLLAGQCDAFVKLNNESWNIHEGRFVKQKSWLWQKCNSDGSTTTNPNIEQ